MFNFSFVDNKKHKFGNIELDALLSQRIKLSNIISKHPLESGEILKDAIHNEPIELSFSAVISDLPQSTMEQIASITNSVKKLLGSKKLKGSKSLRAWRDIHALWKSKTLVTISSPIQDEVFQNMAIKNIEIVPDSTESLNFSVNLEEVTITSNVKAFNNLAPEIGKQSKRV